MAISFLSSTANQYCNVVWCLLLQKIFNFLLFLGNVDIVNGNLKLILGLIWSLIVRYQIGRSKFPPRKLMLAWLQGVLPECKVSNLTTDWNSGILLSALIDYCQPGLFSHWRKLGNKQRANLFDLSAKIKRFCKSF